MAKKRKTNIEREWSVVEKIRWSIWLQVTTSHDFFDLLWDIFFTFSIVSDTWNNPFYTQVIGVRPFLGLQMPVSSVWIHYLANIRLANSVTKLQVVVCSGRSDGLLGGKPCVRSWPRLVVRARWVRPESGSEIPCSPGPGSSPKKCNQLGPSPIFIYNSLSNKYKMVKRHIGFTITVELNE
jgi:hypothetical protein